MLWRAVRHVSVSSLVVTLLCGIAWGWYPGYLSPAPAQAQSACNPEQAILGGATYVRLGKGCVWQPTNNRLPSTVNGYVVEGEDFSVIVRSSDTKGTWITVPNGVTLRTMSMHDRFGWDSFGVDVPRRFLQYSNVSGADQIPGIWDGHGFHLESGPTTGHGYGDTDRPGIISVNHSGGDNFYAACLGVDGVGCRTFNAEVKAPSSHSQAVLVTLYPGVEFYTGFDCRTAAHWSVQCINVEVDGQKVFEVDQYGPRLPQYAAPTRRPACIEPDGRLVPC